MRALPTHHVTLSSYDWQVLEASHTNDLGGHLFKKKSRPLTHISTIGKNIIRLSCINKKSFIYNMDIEGPSSLLHASCSLHIATLTEQTGSKCDSLPRFLLKFIILCQNCNLCKDLNVYTIKGTWPTLLRFSTSIRPSACPNLWHHTKKKYHIRECVSD